ncbi:MAG TPA: MFS transporter [Bacilli bacterium]
MIASLKSPRGTLVVLLIGILLFHLGSYMVLPILPLFLKVQKGLSITEIGLVLAVSPFTFQVGSMLGGVLADRIGRRTIIGIGAWINAAALMGYTIANEVWLFILVGLLSGFGIGLNAPATKAAIAAIASSGNKQTTAFSMRGIAANIGTAAAGLLTFYILGGTSNFVFYTAAAMFILLGLMSWTLLPRGCGEEACSKIPIKSYFSIFQNKAFVAFSVMSMLLWALYAQFALSMPLRAENVLPDPSMVSLVWTVNSFVVIILQTPISRWMIDKIHPYFSLSVGMLFLGGGLGTIYWSNSFYGFVMSGVIFIIGEMLIVPTMDSAISRFGTAQMVGMLFGLANFVSGVGESTGKFVGGQLLSFGTNSIVPWLTFTIAAVITSGLWALLRFSNSVQKPSPDSLAAERLQNNDGKPNHSFIDWVLGRKNKAR